MFYIMKHGSIQCRDLCQKQYDKRKLRTEYVCKTISATELGYSIHTYTHCQSTRNSTKTKCHSVSKCIRRVDIYHGRLISTTHNVIWSGILYFIACAVLFVIYNIFCCILSACLCKQVCISDVHWFGMVCDLSDMFVIWNGSTFVIYVVF